VSKGDVLKDESLARPEQARGGAEYTLRTISSGKLAESPHSHGLERRGSIGRFEVIEIDP
jgi:hypothetical protein